MVDFTRTDTDIIYNKLVRGLNAAFKEANTRYPLESGAPRTIGTDADFDPIRRKQGEVRESMANLMTKRIKDTIVEAAQQNDPGFSLDKLDKGQKEELDKIVSQTVKKWQAHQAKTGTKDQPFSAVKEEELKRGYMQELFRNVAKFFRSITGREKAADFFEKAVHLVVKESAKAIGQAAAKPGTSGLSASQIQRRTAGEHTKGGMKRE